MIEAVVFDFDGTLAELHIDFSEMKARIARIAAPYLGRRPPVPSRPALEWIDVLAQILSKDGTPELSQKFRAEAMAEVESMEMSAARRGKLFPYSKDLLKELRRLGVQTAIITRNCDKAVRTVFPEIHRYCGCLLARDHVSRVKPHPEHLQRALAILGASRDKTLMVGDHPLDVQTGRGAGTWTAAVATGRIGASELRAARPDWVLNDCSELISTLRESGLLPCARAAS